MPRREQPLRPGDEVLLRFARDLRQLREQAGSPTYRQLSARAHFSAAALSEAAGGRKLPSLAMTLAYVGACGGDTEAWEARWREASAELADPTLDERDNDEVPYVGLAAFQISDADWFFGRESLIDDLLSRVRERRFLGVLGASGCGKSSLLRAGLIARLIQESGRTVVFTPGPHPLEECAVQLAAVAGTSPATLRAEFAADPKNVHLRIRQALNGLPVEADLVLVVDQFEEIFTLCQDTAERTWLINALTMAAAAPTSRTRVVLGVRADFYGHCAQHPQLVDALRDAQLLVGPMIGDELRRAITEPAVRAGCRVETALIARLIADAAAQPAVLPLVSHALLETWRHRRGTTLTLTAYEAVGGIQHAIARTAENMYTQLDTDQQTVAHQIFLRLITLGDTTEDTRRRIRRAELDNNPNTAIVLEKLARARLITLDLDSIDLAHEALIRHWPRLRDWLTDDRDSLRIHRQLTDATHAWETHRRDLDTLYRGTRLAQAETWATKQDVALTPREREFLHASVAAHAREQASTRRRATRRRRLVALLAALLLLATGATGYAIRAQQTATEQRNRASAHSVISRIAGLRAWDPVVAAQLVLAAYRLAPSNETRDGLLSAAAAALQSDVHSPAFGPDGRLSAISSVSGTTRLWDIRYGSQPIRLGVLGTHDTLNSVAFSPDRGLLAIGRDDSTFQLWDISNPILPAELATLIDSTAPWKCVAPIRRSALTHRPDCLSLTFSPDGHTLVSTGRDVATKVWDITNPRQPQEATTLDTPDEKIYTVAFSPTGHMLASISTDGVAQLWDISNREHPTRLTTLWGRTGNPVTYEFLPWEAVYYAPDPTQLTFSSEGHLLAVTSSDATVRLWDLANPRLPAELTTLRGHTAPIYSMEFSPDGKSLATAGADATIRLWNVTDPRFPSVSATLTGHTSMVYKVTFSPDGRSLVTSSTDNTNLLWQPTIEQATTRICELARDHAIPKIEWDQNFPGMDYQPPCP